jgi:rhodanese-related sulfurtransferase/CBS domain-containing protein
MSAATIDLERLRRLMDDGAQLVEVLPAEEYEELHLPGAINIPLKQLDADSAQQLDRSRDIVVYCWDALCDLSPRAACRLDALGFTGVYDYAASKVDWLAHGLPAEGTHADLPTAGSLARQDAATCELESSIDDARAALADSPYGFALVLSPAEVLLGRVRRSALDGHAVREPIEVAMEPGPSTIRPHLTLDELHHRLRGSDVNTLIVTRPDGTLLGLVRRDELPQLEAS